MAPFNLRENLWPDWIRLFTLAFKPDPLHQKIDTSNFTGAGVTQPEALPSAGGETYAGGGGAQVRLRDTNDFIDISTITNRPARYKEYERLVNLPEIEMAMTVFADEACVAGDTKIATPFGFIPIEELAEKYPNEEFLVYCWDFAKGDYTLGWAYAPRVVKTAPTVKILLDDGSHFIVTEDHQILLHDGRWAAAGTLKYGDHLKPFYRMKANYELTELNMKQHPRIFTNDRGWIHERQFVDDWKTGRTDPDLARINQLGRGIAGGLQMSKVCKLFHCDSLGLKKRLMSEGFSFREMQHLGKRAKYRRVVGATTGPTIPVFDLSVKEHKCFCTNSVIMHNCQKDGEGNVFKIECDNESIKKELEFVLLHRKMLNLNRNSWTMFKKLCIFGDWFGEIIVDPEEPKKGVYKLASLPPDTMYRIETTKGKVVEFQQSKEGPDYQIIQKAPVEEASESELLMSTAIRFAKQQIIHMRLGDDRKTFYPYGVSLIEPARGPAHQLRLMEDAMVVYRLCIRTYDKVACRKYGWKYMKDITVDDIIYVFNQETGKLEEGKVAWHGLVGQKKTYKASSRHTSITGTNIHPVLAFDSETNITDYVKIKDLIPGRHYFLRPLLSEFEPKKINRYYKQVKAVLSKEQKVKYTKTKYASKKQLIEECLTEVNLEINRKNIQKCWSFLVAEDNCSASQDLGKKLCEKFGLGDPILKNKGEKDPERINLPAYVDEEFAMLFGFLLGDGCINWHKGSAKLLFAAGVYPGLNDKYCSLLTKYFGKCRFQQDKRIDDGLGMYCTNSATACEILENMGYQGNAHEKRIPGWVYNERPEIRKAFIKGFADADGLKRDMVKTPWKTTIRLCNHYLVEDIKQVWESLGFHASEVKKIDEPERWIKDTCIPPSTSWEIYLSEVEVPFHDEIISVAYADTEDVYDLTVEYPSEPNFLCNGVPVKNTRAPERRVFYVDVGQLSPFRADALIERMKDQFRKRKVATNMALGANQIEERWQPPAADEDFWVPMRPGSQTKIDVLPGAQNLGEIDDAIYFRNKVFIALNFPKNYFSNDDPNTTRITLSAQDLKFSRMIERLQASFEDGILELSERHLELRGYPPEMFEDLRIKMTPPSDWRELSRAEVLNNRIGYASQVKSTQIAADFDILTEFMNYDEPKANEMIARNKIQKLEDLKLQIMAQNPALLGIGIPGQEEQKPELGTEPGGPSAMPSPEQQPNPPNQPPPPGGPPTGPQAGPGLGKSPAEAIPLEEPSEDDIKRHDLEIEDYESEIDYEEPDYSVGDD